MVRIGRVLAGTLAAAVLAGGLGGCTPGGVSATVSGVVDGDTIDAVVDGQSQRIRLLNIDTPETVDPDSDVECLGPEASAYLAQLLPPGTPIKLGYDEDRTDGYGRVLAGVFLLDGRLVNAEMARAGLAVPMAVGGNDLFLPPVQQAQGDAIADRRGFHDPAIGCTVPGQVAAVEAALAATTSPPAGASAVEYDTAADQAAALAATALALQNRFDVSPRGVIWVANAADHLLRKGMRTRMGTARLNADATSRTMRDSASVRRTPPPSADPGTSARPTTPKPKPDPTTASEGPTSSTPRVTRPEVEPVRKPAPEPKAAPKPKSSGGSGSDGYTGPRCYAPGGKTYRPC